MYNDGVTVIEFLEFEDEFCTCGHRKISHHYSWEHGAFAECSAWNHHKECDMITDCNCKKFDQMDWITEYCEVPDVLRS